MFDRRVFLKSAGIGTLVLAGTSLAVFTAGCNGSTIAQDIVNWTPSLQSTAATVASAVSVLQPQYAAIVAAVLVGFDAATNLVVAEAKAYLANPGASTLQVLQTAVITLQQQINSALLAAARIVDPKSQGLITSALNAIATVINSIFALITQVKGNTVATQAVSKAPMKISQIRSIIDKPQYVAQSNRMIQEHYRISYGEAHNLYCDGLTQIQAEGF